MKRLVTLSLVLVAVLVTAIVALPRHPATAASAVISDLQVTGMGDYVVIGEVTPHAPYDGWETFVFQGRPCMAVMYDFPTDQLRVCGTRSIYGQRVEVITTWDGTGRAEGVHIFVNGEESEKLVMSDTLSQFPHSTAPLSVGHREGQEGLVFEGTIYSVSVSR